MGRDDASKVIATRLSAKTGHFVMKTSKFGAKDCFYVLVNLTWSHPEIKGIGKGKGRSAYTFLDSRSFSTNL